MKDLNQTDRSMTYQFEFLSLSYNRMNHLKIITLKHDDAFTYTMYTLVSPKLHSAFIYYVYSFYHLYIYCKSINLTKSSSINSKLIHRLTFKLFLNIKLIILVNRETMCYAFISIVNIYAHLFCFPFTCHFV